MVVIISVLSQSLILKPSASLMIPVYNVPTDYGEGCLADNDMNVFIKEASDDKENVFKKRQTSHSACCIT